MLISPAFAQTPNTTASVEVAAPGSEAIPYELSQEKMLKDTLIFLALLFFIFYFVLIRPQQKKFKTHRDMLAGLEKGDEIITAGGLIGRIHKFDGDHVVVVEMGDNVRIRVARSSISEKYVEPKTPVAAAKTAKTANDN